MRRLLLPAAMLLPLLLGASAAAAATSGPPLIDTTITSGPPEGATIEEEEPSFTFAATLDGEPFPGALFQCSLDGAPAQECESPFRLSALEVEGPHSFSVYAEDPLSLARDMTPATRGFVFVQSEAVEEEAEGECEAVEEAELEEGTEEEAEECGEEDENGDAPPPECLLRSARARLYVSPAREKLRLVVRYTSYSPAEVDVEYRVGGVKGPLKLGEARTHFAKRGVFHDTERIAKAELGKVRAARRFTVELGVAGAPSHCRRYETRHLTVRRATHGEFLWLQSGSAFGGDD
jgi:hypothetical protein